MPRIEEGAQVCPDCEEYQDTFYKPQTEVYQIHGREVKVKIERLCCRACGGIIGSDAEDEAILTAIMESAQKLEDE